MVFEIIIEFVVKLNIWPGVLGNKSKCKVGNLIVSYENVLICISRKVKRIINLRNKRKWKKSLFQV